MLNRKWFSLLVLVLLLAGCQDDPDRPTATSVALLNVPTLLAPGGTPRPDVAPTADLALVETVVAATVRAHNFGAGPDDMPPTVSPAAAATLPPCRPVNSWPVYIIRRGDTLSQIALRTSSTVAELTAANCIDRTTPLTVGATLLVPRLPPAPTVAPLPEPTSTGLQVIAFSITPEVVDYDGTFTITWDVRNAGSIYIWTDYWGTDSLPASGSLTIPVADLALRWADTTFTLRAEEAGNFDNSVFAYRRLQVRSNVTIDSFDVTPGVAPSNGAVTLNWSFRGATNGLLSWMPRPYDGIYEPLEAALTASGDRVVPLPDEYYPIYFRLTVEDANGLWVTAETFVETTCPYTYFVADPERQAETCPDGNAISVTGTYQPFERGFMVWASDNDEILVFANNGDVRSFADGWAGEPLPINDEPPPGLFKPIRGFGLVWAGNPDLQAALGWGTAAERNFELVKQQIDRKGSRYGVLTGARYLQLPDGRVVVFYTNWAQPPMWSFLPPAAP